MSSLLNVNHVKNTGIFAVLGLHLMDYHQIWLKIKMHSKTGSVLIVANVFTCAEKSMS